MLNSKMFLRNTWIGYRKAKKSLLVLHSLKKYEYIVGLGFYFLATSLCHFTENSYVYVCKCNRIVINRIAHQQAQFVLAMGRDSHSLNLWRTSLYLFPGCSPKHPTCHRLDKLGLACFCFWKIRQNFVLCVLFAKAVVLFPHL